MSCIVKINSLQALAMLVLVAVPCRAHEGGHGESEHIQQTWQLSNGSTIEGSFVTTTGTHLRLLTAQGVVIQVAVEQLDDRSCQAMERQKRRVEFLNRSPTVKLVAQVGSDQVGPASTADRSAPRPAIADSFKAFEKTVMLRWDRSFLFVESNGLPDHSMMVGIRSWQQQVPLPQSYQGDNAWRITLRPIPAKEPLSANGRFLRGAIALAVNGVPIFNPLNNRGDDAYLFGELDDFGGHCGRADDYHYHLAPVHLETAVGKDKPIAYALDGYPIFGYQDPAAPDFAPLDKINGHKDAHGNYHYHATPKYPYLNGGFYGVVVERDGQVDPQPRAEPIRPALSPLPGAKITKFEQNGASSLLTYEVQGRPGTVRYESNENGKVDFVYIDTKGEVRKESYEPRRRAPGPRRDCNPAGRGMPRSNPSQNNPPVLDDKVGTTSNANPQSASQFQLSSASIDAKGFLQVDCTCDGKRQSPAIAWKHAPAGTQCFAISLWHTAPDREKSYWLIYNIPADLNELKQDMHGGGTLGVNDKRQAEYDPMCSKGPGLKTYHITVFALSQPLTVTPQQMDRQRLLAEVAKYGLGQTTLDFKYERR